MLPSISDAALHSAAHYPQKRADLMADGTAELATGRPLIVSGSRDGRKGSRTMRGDANDQRKGP
jgi:hypothetical protein